MQYKCDDEKAKEQMNQARERFDMLVRSMDLSAEMKQVMYALANDLQEKAEDYGRERGCLSMLQ